MSARRFCVISCTEAGTRRKRQRRRPPVPQNDDDAGARYHLKRVVECVKAAASTFRELEALIGRTGG